MTEIVPAILTDNLESFNQFLNLYKTFAKRIQIDISDGSMVPSSTVDISAVPPASSWPEGKFDLHMMVDSPLKYLPAIIKIHPSLCIFHAESNDNLLPIFEQLSNAGIRTGLAILKPTYPGDVKLYIENVDHVLVFAGALGQQGGEADMLQIEKVPIIKGIDQKVEIGWDGGVTLDNIRAIAHSAVDVINVGSAISRSADAAKAYELLSQEAEKKGVNL